jgi:hypothetical protein
VTGIVGRVHFLAFQVCLSLESTGGQFLLFVAANFTRGTALVLFVLENTVLVSAREEFGAIYMSTNELGRLNTLFVTEATGHAHSVQGFVIDSLAHVIRLAVEVALVR